MPIKNGWNVFIDRRMANGSVCMYLVHSSGIGQQNLVIGEEGKTTLEPVVEGTDIKPFLVMPIFDAEDMLQALTSAIAEHGHKPDSQAKIEGVLEATKYHLEDVRKLVPGLK